MDLRLRLCARLNGGFGNRAIRVFQIQRLVGLGFVSLRLINKGHAQLAVFDGDTRTAAGIKALNAALDVRFLLKKLKTNIGAEFQPKIC